MNVYRIEQKISRKINAFELYIRGEVSPSLQSVPLFRYPLCGLNRRPQRPLILGSKHTNSSEPIAINLTFALTASKEGVFASNASVGSFIDEKAAAMSETNKDEKQADWVENEEGGEVKRSLKLSASFASFGLFLAIACIIGFTLGRWLDKQFETTPYITIFLTLCGVAASVIEIVKIIKKAKEVGEQ